MRQQAVIDATSLVRQAEVGVISTISQNLRGYPFGSVSPFISCSEGKVYFYISDIAQHAKNLNKDSRMSLTVFRQGEEGDQNAQGRVTLIGDAKPLSDENQEAFLQDYVRRFPESESYKQAHDFKMWEMDIVRVRYIGGFGKIFWIEKDEWQQPECPWTHSEAAGMIQHMNEDHQDAMSLILAQHHGIQDDGPLMSGIVSDGFYIQSKDKSYFVSFNNACAEKQDARKELVALTHAAKSAQAA